MKLPHVVALAVITLVLAACIPSLHPFYTERDLAWDARLLGEWREKANTNDFETWKFEKAGTNAYQLTITEKDGKQGEFAAHLFKLENHYFLDLIPTECKYATNQAEIVGFAMFPGHLLVRVAQIEPELKLAFLNFDKLAKLLEKDPTALAYHKEQDRVVLTADTAALQRFVLKHIADEEF
ncbi:MAG TPA: hypothetical protein VNZ22_11410, partial [Bacillota bacterium]|nr:hypothetical protein [Bacillota bacterium]